MKVAENTVVCMRYGMKNSKGETLTTLDDCSVFKFLPGSGVVLPELEIYLLGMSAGEMKSVLLSKDQGLSGLDDDYQFEVLIDEVREATPEEIKEGRPAVEISEADCGADCSCRCDTPL